jgi:alpha-L-arabinofuranosidase
MHYYERGSEQPTQFTPAAMYTRFNLFPHVEAALIHQRALLDGYDPARRIGLILDEWGVWDQIPPSGPDRGLWQQSTMRSAAAVERRSRSLCPNSRSPLRARGQSWWPLS